MRRRRLGATDFELTVIGFGAWALGGQWGPPDDDVSLAAIGRALERGVSWIDTAPGYGCGHSERIVGRAIRGLAERPLISTKCGFVWDGDSGPLQVCLTRESVLREIDASLERLGVDVIDLYQIHWREPDEQIEEAWATLVELKEQGKVRSIGVSNFDVAQMKRCEAIGRIDFIQPPYSMLIRTPLWATPFVDSTPRESIEGEILPYCLEREIGVIVFSPMASGLLAGRLTPERIASFRDDDWRREDPDFHEPLVGRTLALVEQVRPLAARLGVSPGELAIAWTLRHPAVTAAIVGLRSADQADAVVGGAEVAIDDATAAEIDALLAGA